VEDTTDDPTSDAYWLQKLFAQLKVQQARCEKLQNRYEGNAPLPFVSPIQRDAVRWFVEKSRTNWERLIVNSVLARMTVQGIRTAVGDGDDGDAEGYRTYKRARMKLVNTDTIKMALAMSLAYQVTGKDAKGNLLVTAEDPRMMTAITNPENPYEVLAALKVFHDDVRDQDVAYLFRPGRLKVAYRPRKTMATTPNLQFSVRAWEWDSATLNDLGEVIVADRGGDLDWLVNPDGTFKVGNGMPVTVFVNEDGMAEFEPYLNQIDRINQQILQRMTIATIQAFKQRAFKGLPQEDPKTGEKIDYDAIFVADPGAIWNIPAAVEIWESGQVDLQPILMAIRDDVKDLSAVSGTPLYAVTPDAANGSAEGASLQREQHTFKVQMRRDRFEPSMELTAELIFMTIEDSERAVPGSMEIIWAPLELNSISAKANAIAQTKGVMSRFTQLTDIWGMTPQKAHQTLSELEGDFLLDQQYSAVSAANAPAVGAKPAPVPDLVGAP